MGSRSEFSIHLRRGASGPPTILVASAGASAETVRVTGAEPKLAPYVFGHSDVELRRLAFQAALVEPVTRRLLVEAGVTSGMRVLDVGTGRGDVAFLVAELVGETVGGWC